MFANIASSETIRAASAAAAKSVIDIALNRPEPFIYFHWLTNDRLYAYFVHALTSVGSVGFKAGSIGRAKNLLAASDFRTRARILWNPGNHTLLSEQLSGPGIIHINRHFYSAQEAPGRLFMPYYAHPDFYKTGIYKS